MPPGSFQSRARVCAPGRGQTACSMAVSHRDFSVPGNLLAAAREEGREEWRTSVPPTVPAGMS